MAEALQISVSRSFQRVRAATLKPLSLDVCNLVLGRVSSLWSEYLRFLEGVRPAAPSSTFQQKTGDSPLVRFKRSDVLLPIAGSAPGCTLQSWVEKSLLPEVKTESQSKVPHSPLFMPQSIFWLRTIKDSINRLPLPTSRSGTPSTPVSSSSSISTHQR
ncbi:unnamed protein product [Pleuronectes platessa]|uniref:Uncharacterized protein n=1 Tax=Pleuronectes platessa TaxID=8262 RepID=A0A9N7Y7K2_PLEPL|nr:unnamed protein product [Pleuronectes platessa]